MGLNRKIILLTWIFAGCQIGPSYHSPDIAVAEDWKGPNAEAVVPMVENWWEVFRDPQLDELIGQAINNNPTLRAASHRVEQARDFANNVKAKLFPQLNFDPSASNKAQRTHQFGIGPNPPPALIQNHIDRYNLPLTLIYEFDFWAKYRGQYRSAKYLAEAENEAYRTALLILGTDLANAYFQMRILDAEADTYKAALSARKAALGIQESRFETQLADYRPVSEYQIEYSDVEALYFETLKKRALFENQISVLVGASPSEFRIRPNPLKELPPEIPAGIPAGVLLRRPDLAEQERRMAAAHAEINVAYASYFPVINLTGVLNFLSNNFIKTLKNEWLIGSNVVEVLFDGWARGAQVDRMKEKFEEAFMVYRGKVLGAFQEVEDSLVSLHWVASEMKSIGIAVEAAKKDHRMERDRFDVGLSSYLHAANKEHKLLDQELMSLELLGWRYFYTIHLIKAIGGGWK